MAAILWRHFQMHFLEWKSVDFDKILLEIVPKFPSNNIPALVQIS